MRACWPVASTVLGDALVRGVSGGQKRRVTIDEALLAAAPLLLLVEPTNGHPQSP